MSFGALEGTFATLAPLAPQEQSDHRSNHYKEIGDIDAENRKDYSRNNAGAPCNERSNARELEPLCFRRHG
jgi:hypothetical protein